MTNLQTRPWSALRHRDYRLLWAATFVSNAGSWMQKVATSWLVFKMTGSELWLGTEAFVSGFTTVTLLPFGGVISDRFDRRRLLIWTNTICAALAFALATLAWARHLHVWHILLISGLSGVVQSVLVPASTSLLPALVGEKDVRNAIALNSLQFNVSRVVGPAVGGVTLTYLGAGWSFGINALSFLVLAAAFIFIRQVPPVAAGKRPLFRSLVDGGRFVRRRRDVLMPIALVGAMAFLGAPAVSLLPALVINVLGRASSSYSVLLSSFGAGAVLAGILAAFLGKRLNHTGVMATAVVGVGAAEIGLAFGGWHRAVGLAFVAGLGFVGMMIQLGTSILEATPDEYRGRVTSLQQVCFRAGQPLGALIGGAIGRLWGVRSSFCTFGAALAVVGFAWALVHKRSLAVGEGSETARTAAAPETHVKAQEVERS